jgi:protein SCO1/2
VRKNFIIAAAIAALLASGCSDEKRYTLVGQIVAVDAAQQVITVKHEDIRGFMPGMTMPFKVRNAAEISGRRPGDLITATLVVEESRGVLEDIRKTGEAPLVAPAPPAPAAALLEKGAVVPDTAFIDQDGRTRHLADWKGKTVAVTFIYTRCPLPDFCPLMDRNFSAVQRALKADSDLASRVHLLSVSFDPRYDTPEVLKAHAGRVQADPAVWTYLTGSPEAIDTFAGGFGVAIMREDPSKIEIVHNLRTAVIDKEGRLFNVLRGNEWKPDELLAELRAADARR